MMTRDDCGFDRIWILASLKATRLELRIAEQALIYCDLPRDRVRALANFERLRFKRSYLKAELTCDRLSPGRKARRLAPPCSLDSSAPSSAPSSSSC